MMNAEGQITIVRKHPTLPVGIDRKANAYDLETGVMLRRVCYDGRLVYRYGKKQIGYATFKKQPSISLLLQMHPLPF